MTMPNSIKERLNRMYDCMPAETREAFAAGIRRSLRDFQYRKTVKFALLGGLLGYLIDFVPFCEDHVELGALLGAWAGYAADGKERKKREELTSLIMGAYWEAMAVRR